MTALVYPQIPPPKGDCMCTHSASEHNPLVSPRCTGEHEESGATFSCSCTKLTPYTYRPEEMCICGHAWAPAHEFNRNPGMLYCANCGTDPGITKRMCEKFTPVNTIPPEGRCTNCPHGLEEHGKDTGKCYWFENSEDGSRTSLCGCKNGPVLPRKNRNTNTETGDPNVATKKKESYFLPDGREYITRNLGGYDNDVEGLRELAKMGKHILLLGEPGCGKTALHQVAFPDSENEIGHSKLTAFDMLWRPRPLEDGTIQFDPSPLTRAVMGGKPFYLDEIMRSSEDALTPLFSAMDGRGFIVGGNLDGTDLPVKPGFVVIGASNPMVRGAFLPDAIASRFHILTVETSQDLLEQLGLDERLLVIWRNLSSMAGGEVWRPSIREMLAAQSFIDVGNLTQAAYALTGYRIKSKDRELVAGVVAPLLGVRVTDKGGLIK